MASLDAAAGHLFGVGDLAQPLFTLRPQVQMVLEPLPHQLPCTRREQLPQFGVGGVVGTVWVSQLLDQSLEHRAGDLARLNVRVRRVL